MTDITTLRAEYEKAANRQREVISLKRRELYKAELAGKCDDIRRLRRVLFILIEEKADLDNAIRQMREYS